MNSMFKRAAGLLALATTAASVLILNSCGSGAVTGTTPPTGTALVVTPAVSDAYPDTPTSFTISGGTPGYTIFSSNSVALPIASATVTGNTFTVIPGNVAADTSVDITVRDAVNAATTAKANIHPSTLLNQIVFTPSPIGAGCGTNTLCSGGDAQVTVQAVQNGVILRNRSIRFDVFQGSFQLVTPGSGTLVNSLLVNTDDQGFAVARIVATAGAATQVATIQTTDVLSGLPRRYNFTIVQQVSGTGILSTLPSGSVTITGAKGAPGADGACPSGPSATVDYYIYGGTPPYHVASPLPGVASVSPSVVTTSGGKFTVQVNGCGTVSFIVTDSTGRAIETASLQAVQGAKGDTVTTTPTSLTVTPTTATIACGSSGSATVSGSGSFSTFVFGSGPSSSAGNGFVVTPANGVIPGTITFSAVTGQQVFSPVAIDVRNGTLTQRITVTVTGILAGNICS